MHRTLPFNYVDPFSKVHALWGISHSSNYLSLFITTLQVRTFFFLSQKVLKPLLLKLSIFYQPWKNTRRGGRGRNDWEFGVSRCKLLYVGWINNKRRELHSVSCDKTIIEKNIKNEIYMCITELFFCTGQICTTL